MKTLEVVSRVLCIFLVTVLETQGQVISEPDDVTVCEGTVSTSLSCVLNSNMSSDDVQWYRLIKGTNTAQRVPNAGGDFVDVPLPSQNRFTAMLYIYNARRSYTGYYWVKLPYDDVCNVSLTVTTDPPALTVNIMKNNESSIVVQWNKVDNSLPTTVVVMWTSKIDHHTSPGLVGLTSYTITGLTLDTVYNITVYASNTCGNESKFITSILLTTTKSTSLRTAKASTTPSITTTITSPSISTVNTIAMPSTSTVNPGDASAADGTGNGSVYIIVGVVIGVIIVLSLLIIVIVCCFMRRKDISNKKNEYSDLISNCILDKNIPMVPDPLSTNDEDKKSAKPEVEISQEKVEVHYMMPNLGSNVGSNTNTKQCDVLDKSQSKEKEDTEIQQPMGYAVVDNSKKKKKKDDKQQKEKLNTKNQQPLEYAVVDKSKKTKKKDDKQEKEKEDTKNQQPMEYAVVDKSKKKMKNDDKQEKLQYAVLETLPKPTGAYVASDDSVTQYSLVS